MRPTAPSLKVSQTVGPSPPHTPRTTSPPIPIPIPISRAAATRKPQGFPPSLPSHRLRSMAPVTNIHPVGNGPNFSYSRPIRPEQLSPRSSSSSSSAASDSDSFGSGSPPRSVTSEQPDPTPAPAPFFRRERIITIANFELEELSDFSDAEERAGAVRPYHIEYAESERSRSRSRNPPEIDQTVMYKLRDLSCGISDDSDDMDDAEFQELVRKRREVKRRKRMTSGSIGKRTISESIGSDTDHEDLRPFLDISELGSSARRLRRRVGDRRSLQFPDPPPPRIDELEEPNTSDDELIEGETLARELPYYELEYISMEIDSP